MGTERDERAKMDKIDLKCGFLCNNRCIFCVQGNKRSKFGDLPTEQLIESLTAARGECEQVVLTGGEVTIKKDFLYLVKTAKELGFSLIQIQTNGRMFADRRFCEETIEAGANEFSLALHGHIPSLHDYLTRADGSFIQTAKGIRNLSELGQFVGTNSVITRSNYRHLPELAKLLIHLGVRQYQFAFVHALGEAARFFSKVVPRFTLVEPYVKKGISHGIELGISVMTEAIPLCFMVGYEDFVAEKIIPRTKIYDVSIIEDFTQYRLQEGKIKGKPCVECAYDPVCEGPWKEYPEYYGWNEFQPVHHRS